MQEEKNDGISSSEKEGAHGFTCEWYRICKVCLYTVYIGNERDLPVGLVMILFPLTE